MSWKRRNNRQQGIYYKNCRGKYICLVVNTCGKYNLQWINTLLYPIYHWTSLKTDVQKNISCHLWKHFLMSISVKAWGIYCSKWKLSYSSPDHTNFFMFILVIKNVIFVKTLSIKSWVTISRTISKPHISNYLQRKQTCCFANLRIVGYSEVQRDVWQNLWMRVSSIYDIFMFYVYNYLFVLSKCKYK